MKINRPLLDLTLGKLFLLLFITCVIGGPPFQGKVPIGLYEEDDEVLQTKLKTPSNINFDQEDTYRLPLSVRPSHYDLEIRPIIDSADESEQYTAPGKVAIRIKCFEETNIITLHSKKDIEIKHDEVTVVGVDPQDPIGVTEHSVDEERHFYNIHLERSLTENEEYVLTIPFIAPVSTDLSLLAGLYLSSYLDTDGTRKYFATTQFQKDDASRAFPCFDEPSEAFRATFNVKIGRKEVGFHSLANMEKDGVSQPIPDLPGWVWDSHETTVNMSPYLIAIIVSDFESHQAPDELYPGKEVRTWAAPPLMTDTSGQFSAEAAARILKFFEEYFDYPYQLSKMDSVAINDFAAGAMENWGLNTYRINLMVWLEEENTLFEKWRSAAVIAHELAHQWFGNMVTCEWWNDTWLNEGFARYLQFIGANYSGGDFRSLDRYVLDVTQVAMDNDVLDTEPVHSNVTDRIVNQKTRIVYEKAAALIRMMQAFLTEDTLIKGLRTYLKRHQYAGVVQDDLFAALQEQADADGTFTQYTVKQVMDSWTLQSGFPIIRVSRADQTRLIISQEKFRLNRDENDDTLWYVPISYVTASDPDFSDSNLGPKDWMDNETLLKLLTVDSTDQWVIINPDARGFYRVIYDNTLRTLIEQQLQSDHLVISVGSRSQMIDDYFKSAAAGYVDIRDALGLTRYLSKENDFIAWTTVVSNLLPIYNRLTDTPTFEKLSEYILSLVIDPLENIGGNQLPDDSTEVAVLRTQLLDWACSMGHEICRNTAFDRFSAWRSLDPAEKIPIAADIQPMLYCGAVAASNDPSNTTIQEFLMGEYDRNRGDRQRSLIINALACDQVEGNLQNLMESALEEDANIRTHAVQLLQAIARNSAGRPLIFKFVEDREATINPTSVASIISALAPYVSKRSSETSLSQDEVEAFIGEYLKREDIPDSVRTSLTASLGTIARNNDWMDINYDPIASWLSEPIN